MAKAARSNEVEVAVHPVGQSRIEEEEDARTKRTSRRRQKVKEARKGTTRRMRNS